MRIVLKWDESTLDVATDEYRGGIHCDVFETTATRPFIVKEINQKTSTYGNFTMYTAIPEDYDKIILRYNYQLYDYTILPVKWAQKSKLYDKSEVRQPLSYGTTPTEINEDYRIGTGAGYFDELDEKLSSGNTKFKSIIQSDDVPVFTLYRYGEYMSDLAKLNQAEFLKIKEYIKTGEFTPPGGIKGRQGISLRVVSNSKLQEIQVDFRNLIGDSTNPLTKPTGIEKVSLTFHLGEKNYVKDYTEFPNGGFQYNMSEFVAQGFDIISIIKGEMQVGAIFYAKVEGVEKGVSIPYMNAGVDEININTTVLDNMPCQLSYIRDNPDDPNSNPTNDGDITNSDSEQDTLEDIDINNNVSGVMTTTYSLQPSDLVNLGSWLWNADLGALGYKNINNNPIENIISLKAIPFAATLGEKKNILFGNIDTGLNHSTVANQIIKKTFTINTYDIFPKKLSWLSYSNYINFMLYLPFFNSIGLATKDCYGKYKNSDGWHYGVTITVTYTIDCISGDCTVEVKSSKGNNIIYSATTNIGIDVPLFATNRASKEQSIMYATDIAKMNAVKTISGAIGGAIGVGGGIAQNPTPMGIGSNLLSGGLNTIIDTNNSFKMQEINLRQAEQIGFSVSQSGAVGGSSAINICNIPYIIMHYPTWYTPEDFEKRKGRPVYKTKYIMESRGFIKMDKSLKITNLSGATQTMKKEIYNILTSGFYATYNDDEKYLSWDELEWIANN